MTFLPPTFTLVKTARLYKFFVFNNSRKLSPLNKFAPDELPALIPKALAKS